ncbi:methyl-accepting chemotaxis protein [Bacillus sp. FSL K6-3431]|uniref:methyl-accepting chemotaxis protein n=1 Tax=Bacillus sp. FSL K6-3431 TaxID=2921500 RepID=UPI0030FA921D
MKQRKYKFGLQKRLVIFTTLLALITYSTSAIFIYFVYPYVTDYISQQPFVILTLSLGIIWSGILAYAAASMITKPLQRMEQAVVRAGEGDIGTDVEVTDVDDEINSLGRAFNVMIGNLREMIHHIDENFNKTNENVIAISQKSKQAAEKSENASHTMSEISSGAESSAAAIQATAESVEDISGIALDVQEKAKASEQVSIAMVDELMASKQIVQSLVDGIERLALENRTSLKTVRKLEEHAKEVEQIIKLVGDIANQTNLLALNASIEAARAGEHGKGFAVVAEEVRKLADESATAVQGISGLIQNIQAEVENVVVQMSDQAETANTEALKGTQTNEAIEEITATIHQVASSVQSISELVDNQMASVQKTSIQSQEVAAIAQETSAGAEEVARKSIEQAKDMEEIDDLSEQLKIQASILKDTITRFHI